MGGGAGARGETADPVLLVEARAASSPCMWTGGASASRPEAIPRSRPTGGASPSCGVAFRVLTLSGRRIV
jgi:hypothetical protein